MLKLDLDFRSNVPLTNQIVAQIQNQLADGVLHPGDQLPTVRALAAELRVNFNTVARAYRLLDEAGIISTQQGRGTFILDKPPTKASEQLRRESLKTLAQRYLEEAKRLGFGKDEALEAVVKKAIEQSINEKLPETNPKSEDSMIRNMLKPQTRLDQRIPPIAGTIFAIILVIAAVGAILMDGKQPDALIGAYVSILMFVGC